MHRKFRINYVRLTTGTLKIPALIGHHRIHKYRDINKQIFLPLLHIPNLIVVLFLSRIIAAPSVIHAERYSRRALFLILGVIADWGLLLTGGYCRLGVITGLGAGLLLTGGVAIDVERFLFDAENCC